MTSRNAGIETEEDRPYTLNPNR